MNCNEKKDALICVFAVVCVAIMAAASFVCLASSSNVDDRYQADDSSLGASSNGGSFWIDSIKYEIIDDGVRVSEIKNRPGFVEIPNEVENEGKTYVVREIGSTVLITSDETKCTRSLSIGPSIRSIAERAFSHDELWDIHPLGSFEIRDIEHSQLKYIGKNAFKYCDLFTITLPKSLEKIDCHAFLKCFNLRTCYLNSASLRIESYAFQDCKELAYINLEHVTYIGESCFKHDHKIEVCNLYSAVTIEKYAFWDVNNAKVVIIGSGLQSIGDRQFHGQKFMGADGKVIRENANSLRGHMFLIGDDGNLHSVA